MKIVKLEGKPWDRKVDTVVDGAPMKCSWCSTDVVVLADDLDEAEPVWCSDDCRLKESAFHEGCARVDAARAQEGSQE